MIQTQKKLSILSVILSAVAAFSFIPSVMAASFPDVPENTPDYGAVEYLKQKGVISGYDDGTFKPDKTINRAEALKIVTIASGAKPDSQGTLSFPDVKVTDWFYPYVVSAFNKKIVEGYSDGTFKPGNNINVAESLKMILLSFGVDVGAAPATKPFPDVDTTAWFSSYAAYSRTKQIIWSLDDGLLHAERDITRGDFAEIIYRLMYVREKNLESFPLSTDWPTYTHPTDHYLMKVPFGWIRTSADKETILWKQDTGNGQVSFSHPFPNGATIVFAVDPNEARTAFADYVDAHNFTTTSFTQKLTLNNYPFATISEPDLGRVAYFFELPNKSILLAYADVGKGDNQPQLQEEVRNVIGSVRYSEATGSAVTDKDTFLADIRKKILVTGAGTEVLSLFNDELLIETDTIGIGTGPVDYYYSAEYDVTLKYERNSNTLLALSNGKNTTF